MIDSPVRASLAAIVLSHASGRLVTSVHDHGAGIRHDIRAIFRDSTLDGHATARAARLGGTLPDLYDHARRAHIHLTCEGDTYSGFDHGTGTHFHVVISGQSCSLYDHDAGEWSQYGL